jgi:hypothetical protein
MNYALVDNTGLVVNVIVWDGESDWQPPEGLTAVLITGNAGIGWSYIDGEFIPPLDNL